MPYENGFTTQEQYPHPLQNTLSSPARFLLLHTASPTASATTCGGARALQTALERQIKSFKRKAGGAKAARPEIGSQKYVA
jgi:hypothetical protein